jgi:hypothetical protein
MSALLKPQPDLFKPRIDAPPFPWNDQTEADVWRRFDEKWTPEPNSGCYLWTGAVANYPRFRMGDRTRQASHVAYERWVGPIPKGMQACHRCDNRFCVNPDHLFLGTQLENMRDMTSKGRRRGGPKHAPHKPWALNDEQVAEIRSKKKSGVAYAKQFKVTPRSIYNVWTGRTWSGAKL